MSINDFRLQISASFKSKISDIIPYRITQYTSKIKNR